MKGKVFFEVECNAKLPFRILASDAVVSVLGTCFQVLHSTDSTCVDVVSGSVSLAASAYPESGDRVSGSVEGNRNLTGSFRAESVSEAVSIIEETINVKITIQ